MRAEFDAHAQAADPDRQVPAPVGDGGFTKPVGGLATAVKDQALARDEPSRARIGEALCRDEITDFTAPKSGHGRGSLRAARAVLRRLTVEEKRET